MLKAIKVRLYPTPEQENYISRLVGSCRYVFNSCLSHRIEVYNTKKETVSFGELGKYLVSLKENEDTKWLKEVHSKVLQQVLINLDIAYKSFFKNGNGFPKFKSKKNNKESCRFPVDAISNIKGNRINIIKQLKDIHFKCSRRDEILLNENQDSIKSGTLSKTKSGTYYFSLLLEIPSPIIQQPTTQSSIGIDLGIKDFLVDSNGNKYENLKLIRTNEPKLKKLHRSLSKKIVGSNNRNKARIKLARFHDKLNNIKDFYLHKISNKILDENQIIVIEDLNVSGMMKNKYLSKSIGELSLSRFKTILGYKSSWRNKTLIEIDRYFPSSKKCNCCGRVNQNLTLSDRTWKCSCGKVHDRDINAAKNILDEGLRLSKLGMSSPEVTLEEIGDNKSGRRIKNKMSNVE